MSRHTDVPSDRAAEESAQALTPETRMSGVPRRAYEAPRLLGVESLEAIAAACAPVNPQGPGKSFPAQCAGPGS